MLIYLSLFFKWFPDDQMKANLEKCHLLVNKGCRKKINIGNNNLGNTKCKNYSESRLIS